MAWYEFKSTSKKAEVMTRDHFCGVDAGPRTVFIVDVICGYDISRFSFFQGLDSEYEVLLLPMSQFEVVHAAKNIIDPKESEQAGVRVVRYAAAVQVSGATGTAAHINGVYRPVAGEGVGGKPVYKKDGAGAGGGEGGAVCGSGAGQRRHGTFCPLPFHREADPQHLAQA